MQDNLVNKSEIIDLISNAAPDVTLILDFDETLLLRNSTAEYINSLRPRFLGFLLISILKVIKLWRWLPQASSRGIKGDKIRDWFLVVIPTLLLPWTLLLWQKKAKRLAQEYSNLELIEAVQQKYDSEVSNVETSDSQIIIASLGFNFVIKPILEHIPIRSKMLIGCRFWQGAGDRTKGKLVMLQEKLSDAEIKSAIVVTDSQDDLPLLQVVSHPCLTIWSLARYIDPFSDYWLFELLRRLKKMIIVQKT